ncbi:hypothetical protein H0H87_003412 [Tephrocybe sp. NHM501043]|nr:hypothetical protein H0H87_003412 [Tephrocybe sp. NHM501043]
MSDPVPPSLTSSISKEERERGISPQPGDANVKGVDAALVILQESSGEPISAEDDGRVLRKIDLWIMPVVLLVYFTQQLDKQVFTQLEG